MRAAQDWGGRNIGHLGDQGAWQAARWAQQVQRESCLQPGAKEKDSCHGEEGEQVALG